MGTMSDWEKLYKDAILGDFASNRDEMFDHSQFVHAAPSPTPNII